MQSTKYLSFTLDECLTFKQNVDHLMMKKSKWVGTLHKLKIILPIESVVKLYKSFIQLYIHCGLEVWYSVHKNLKNKIFIPYNHDTLEFIKTQEILKLDDSFKLKTSNILIKCMFKKIIFK